MKVFIIGFSVFIIASCSSFQRAKKHDRDWELFSNLEIGKETTESVRQKLGNPSEINKDGVKEEQWVYADSIDWVYFKDGTLEYVSMIVDDTEMANITTLLTKFPGKWKIEKEPVTLVDAMPFMCYLIDDVQGKEIEINSYKKIAEVVSRGKPNQKRPPPRKSITSWGNYDHCAWLKNLVKSKGLLNEGAK